jgi:hypothetical protein
MVISGRIDKNLLFKLSLGGGGMKSRFSPFYPISYTNADIYLKLQAAN